MYFTSKKRDPHRDLTFTVNIEGQEIEVKKLKL